MASSSEDIQNNKRRKICTDINITDLDDEAIRRVAIFLPKTSRALLAVALTTGTESSKWNDIEWNKSSTPSILSLVSTYNVCGVHILCIYIALTTVSH